MKRRVKVKNIFDISRDILVCNGVPKEHAAIVADTIVYAHTREKHTHGLNRLPIYIRKINEGLMTPNTSLTSVVESQTISVFDAGNGFGQVAAYQGVERVIEKANHHGVGIVGIKDSNNFGTAGYFGEKITEKNMIGIVLGNSAPAIAPIGGEKPIMGTNPICLSFPTPKSYAPIVLDMATTVAARGKIRLALHNHERIPIGWAVDKKGKLTNDPEEALKGSLVPIGGAKGFGLALAVDILAGLLTGSAFGGEVKNLNHPTEISRYGHFIMALNIEFFLSEEEYEDNIQTLIKAIKNCSGENGILLPGEGSHRKAVVNAEYVNINEIQIRETNELAKKYGSNNRL